MKHLSFFLSLLIALTSTTAYPQINPVTAQNLTQNYIFNGGFENAKHGWAAYKNTSSSTPVNGTGGSPTTTVTTTTSTPLAGKSSGVLTHPASNVQGEGISYSFAIEPGARGRTISITGVYQISSGTYSGGSSSTDSDVEVYIYDVDAGTIIQPAGYKLDGGVTGTNYNINATFQSAYADTNYRLILHEPNTTATAFALKIDSIVVSLQGKSVGAAETDWTSYTPTGSWVTNTSYTGKWRRQGDTMEGWVWIVTTGAVTATNLTVNLPTGYSIDTTKISGAGSSYVPFGQGSGAHASNAYAFQTAYNNTTSVSVLYQVSNAALQAGVTNTAPVTWSSDYLTIYYKVPIAGWSSNTTVSDLSGDSRVVAFSTQAAANASIGSTPTTVTWNSPFTDTHSGFNGSTTYTVPVPGTYIVQVTGIPQTPASGGGTSGTSNWTLQKNGGQIWASSSQYGTTYCGVANYCSPTPMIYTGAFKAGDTILVQYSQNAGGTGPQNIALSSWSITKLAGPSQIAASDSVNAAYTNVAGTSVPGSAATVIPFATKSYDTHSAWSGTAYVCPISGKFRFNASVLISNGSYASGAQWVGFWSKNGTAIGYGDQKITSGSFGSSTVGASATVTANCVTGDSFSFSVSQSAGVTGSPVLSATAGACHAEIERVGN